MLESYIQSEGQSLVVLDPSTTSRPHSSCASTKVFGDITPHLSCLNGAPLVIANALQSSELTGPWTGSV